MPFNQLQCYDHQTSVSSVAISSDNRYILSGSSARQEWIDAGPVLTLWDTFTGKQLQSFQGHTESVCSVAFTPKGDYAISSSADNTIRLWEVATGRQKGCIGFEEGSLLHFRLFPGGDTFLVYGGSFLFGDLTARFNGSRELRQYDVLTGSLVRAFGFGCPLAAVSPNGKDIACAWMIPSILDTTQVPHQSIAANILGSLFRSDRHINRVGNGFLERRLKTPPSYTSDNSSWFNTDIAFSPDGRFLLAGEIEYRGDSSWVSLWDVASGERISRVGHAQGPVFCVAFANNGRWGLAGGRGLTHALVVICGSMISSRVAAFIDLVDIQTK